MKIAVINFSGNVGKSTIARHLIMPRIPGAEFIPVESINADDSSEEAVRGKQWGDLKEYLMQVDDAVVDIGASNVEDLFKLMKQHRGSHAEFDYFVVPTVKEAKQQKDTIATIDALAALGISAKQIRLVFNKLDTDETVASCFGALLAYRDAEKKFVLNEKAAVEANEVFEKLKPLGKTLAEVLADETDYRAALREAKTPEEKQRCISMISVKQLAISANENLDAVHKALFK